MRYARISDGYRLATSAFTTRRATPVANRCSAAPLCGVPSPAWCAGSAVPDAQVRAHEQRIDHAGRGAGVGEPLVAPRRHPRERERRAAEHAREPGDLLDVGGRVAPHARRDRVRYDVVDLIAGDVLAIRPREAEVPRDRLEAVPGQLARREVVAQHGVERVDQLAARARRSARGGRSSVAARHAAPRGALAQPRRPDAAERERHAEPARAAIEERQIEAVQVVVLDHVGIGRLHARDEPRGSDRPRPRRRRRAPRAARSRRRDRAPRPGRSDRARGSSPVVSRSNCRRRSSSNGRSRK